MTKGLENLVNSCIDFLKTSYGDTIYLDLNKTILYGTQPSVNGYVLDSLIEGIKAGDDFPSVFVSRNFDGSYNIELVNDKSDPSNYGGHHRAIAHMQMNAPLKCMKVKNSGKRETLIRDILVSKSKYDYDNYLKLKRNNERYR